MNYHCGQKAEYLVAARARRLGAPTGRYVTFAERIFG